MVIKYTNYELLQLREHTVNSLMRETKTVYNVLKQLDISYVTTTHRGTTGGLIRQHWQPETVESNSVGLTLGVTNLQRRIPTIIGNRPTAHPAKRVGTSPLLHDNLISVQLSSNPRTYLSQQVSLCLLNARSIRNKTTDILDHVQQHDIDIVAMTETWLSNKDADLPVMQALTPQGYSFIHHPRSKRRGGGIGILRKDYIKATGKHTFNRIRSCEAMSVKLTYHAKSITLLVIYRPPPTSKNGSSAADFLSEFSDILDTYIPLADELVIVGDFNFRFDAPDNVHVRHLSDLLHCHGLTQHVKQPTHQDGHIIRPCDRSWQCLRE